MRRLVLAVVPVALLLGQPGMAVADGDGASVPPTEIPANVPMVGGAGRVIELDCWGTVELLGGQPVTDGWATIVCYSHDAGAPVVAVSVEAHMGGAG